MAKHASEDGHWYRQDGEQVESVPYASDSKDGLHKKGDPRAPNLRDAKKTGDPKDKTHGEWCRGVTSVIGKAYRGQLEEWKIKQGILAALRFERSAFDEAMAQAIEKAGTVEDKKLSDTLKNGTYDTVAGMTKFGGAAWYDIGNQILFPFQIARDDRRPGAPLGRKIDSRRRLDALAPGPLSIACISREPAGRAGSGSADSGIESASAGDDHASGAAALSPARAVAAAAR